MPDVAHRAATIGLALVLAGCAPSSSRTAAHPAHPAHPVGRLAGAPASLRPGVVAYPGTPKPGTTPAAPPAHHHHHAP